MHNSFLLVGGARETGELMIKDGDDQVIFIICYFTNVDVGEKKSRKELFSDIVVQRTVKNEVD